LWIGKPEINNLVKREQKTPGIKKMMRGRKEKKSGKGRRRRRRYYYL